LELVGDQAVGSAEERLGRAVELIAESIRGFLADRPHAVLELERACLGSSIDFTGDRSLYLFHLPALDLGERDLDSRSRLALCSIDLLGDRMLVLAEPLGHVVDCATTVVRMRLQLVECLSECVLGTGLERFAQPKCSCALLIDRRSKLGGFGLDPGLDIRDSLPEALLEGRHSTLERILRSLEVGFPCSQSLLDALFDRGDQLSQAFRELAFADAELTTPLVR
jgi:hypothetical protein